MQEEGLDVEAALKAVQAATTLTQPNQAFLAGGDVRMGDFILLVDSDTRVPEHCILPVVSELLRSRRSPSRSTTPRRCRRARHCFVRWQSCMLRAQHCFLWPTQIYACGDLR